MSYLNSRSDEVPKNLKTKKRNKFILIQNFLYSFFLIFTKNSGYIITKEIIDNR